MTVNSKKCCVEGCETKARNKGYCAKHYAQEVRKGNIVQKKKKKSNDYFINDDNTVTFITEDKYGEVDRYFIVDVEDWDKIKNYRWYACGREPHRYARTKSHGNVILLHRFILGVENEDTKLIQVDHIDGDVCNNRKENLRVVTPQQNAMNKDKVSYGDNKHNGVHFMKSKHKWRAYITYENKWIHIGVYDTEEQAKTARRKAEESLYGEFRRKQEEE